MRLLDAVPLFTSLTVSSGRDGWLLAEPGDYVVQVAVHLPEQDLADIYAYLTSIKTGPAAKDVPLLSAF